MYHHLSFPQGVQFKGSLRLDTRGKMYHHLSLPQGVQFEGSLNYVKFNTVNMYSVHVHLDRKDLILGGVAGEDMLK